MSSKRISIRINPAKHPKEIAWLNNQDNRTQSINLAISIACSKYGTGDLVESVASEFEDDLSHKIIKQDKVHSNNSVKPSQPKQISQARNQAIKSKQRLNQAETRSNPRPNATVHPASTNQIHHHLHRYSTRNSNESTSMNKNMLNRFFGPHQP